LLSDNGFCEVFTPEMKELSSILRTRFIKLLWQHLWPWYW